MLLPGIAEQDIVQFNGAVTRLEPYTIPSDKALYAQNCTYLRGQVATRLGHSVTYTLTDGAITRLQNWFFTFSGAQVSVVAYYAPSAGVRTLQQPGGTITTIMNVTGAAGAVMLPTGQRLYAAFYDSSGRIGVTGGGQVYGWNIGADPLFAAPLTNVPTVSETGAGVCTPGLHRFGFLTQTRNGYTGKPCPVNSGGTFVPVSFTSTGNKNIQVSIPGPFPSYMTGGFLQPVMSPVSNPNRYFAVPGTLTLSGANPTNISFSITDDDLTATGTDVTSYVTLLQSSPVGPTPPFNPSAVFQYSSRLGYVTIDASGNPVIYMSDPNNYQKITPDQHALYVEGQQQPVQGVSLRGVCYIGCTSGFYSTEDNGSTPVSWTPPQRVDGSVGILSATCISENPALGYALVGSEKGLYLFQGGIFPPLPLSYYQDSDWSRINWNVATQVQIGDDQSNRRFMVAAPLTMNVLSVTGVGPFTITTAYTKARPQMPAAHLYQTGLSVTIAGVTGAQSITVTGPNTFTIPGGAGTPTVGGLIAPQTASAVMTWDYTEGDTPETVKYSINAFTAYRAEALAIIRNQTTLINEIWYAPAANGPLIRQNDGSETNPYRDVDLSSAASAINSLYETALHPNPLAPGMTVHDYYGCHMAVRGNGALNMQAFGINHVRSVVPARSGFALQSVPQNEELVKWSLRSERQSIQLGTNAVDAFFVLSVLRAYYGDAFPQR